jgi:signal peptidase
MAAQQTPTRGVRRLSRCAVNFVLLVVVVGCVAWLAPSALGYDRYVITGGSMTGTYDKGSVVFEKQVPVSDLAVGDVVTYLPPADSGVANLVTHRIVRIERAEGGGSLFRTQGDHNPQVDPWKFQLTGAEQPVVQFGVPHVGWVFIALADRNLRMLAIGGPATLIALIALGQLVGALRDRRRPEDAPAVAALLDGPAPAIPAQRQSEPAREPAHA